MTAAPQTAFILAAGLGTRMRPLTLTRPKPMVEVAGKPLVRHVLDHVIEAELPDVIVNVHYLADQIENYLAKENKIRIHISDERERLLDSGGAIKKQRRKLGSEPVLVLNSDSFWLDRKTPNIKRLCKAFKPSDMDVLMLFARRHEAIGYDGAGDAFLRPAGQVEWRGTMHEAPYVFAGVSLIKPELFDAVEQETFSLKRIFDAAHAKERLFGLSIDGLWLHVGTPDAIVEAEIALEAFQSVRL
jgi:N-acetyl-alpha-D-muramate 1-phosphate uridylyltransferase